MRSLTAIICALMLDQCSFCEEEEEYYLPTTYPQGSYSQRAQEVLQKEGEYSLAIIGDSTTQHFERYPECEPDNYVNLGVAGETIQQMLWRVNQGQFDGIQAHTIWINAGTNNMATHTAEQIAEGIELLEAEINLRTSAEVVVFNPFPAPKYGDKPERVGEIIQGQSVTMTQEQSTDGVHWNKEVYCEWSSAPY